MVFRFLLFEVVFFVLFLDHGGGSFFVNHTILIFGYFFLIFLPKSDGGSLCDRLVLLPLSCLLVVS